MFFITLLNADGQPSPNNRISFFNTKRFRSASAEITVCFPNKLDENILPNLHKQVDEEKLRVGSRLEHLCGCLPTSLNRSYFQILWLFDSECRFWVLEELFVEGETEKLVIRNSNFSRSIRRVLIEEAKINSK